MSADKSETTTDTAAETSAPRPGRNDACHCGSGKKYKKCHLDKDEAEDRKLRQVAAAQAAATAAAAATGEDDAKDEKPARGKPERNEAAAPSPGGKMSRKAIFQRKVGGS